MGLISSLAFLLIPFASRSKARVIPIVSETTRLKAEIETLKATNEALQGEVLRWMDLAPSWRERAERRSQMPRLPTWEEMQASNLAQSYQQAQNVGMARLNWHHRDCTPQHGRYGFLRGEGLNELAGARWRLLR